MKQIYASCYFNDKYMINKFDVGFMQKTDLHLLRNLKIENVEVILIYKTVKRFGCL